MINGDAKERESVWGRSVLWGCVWQIGDAVYYAGVLGSLCALMVLLLMPKGSTGVSSKALMITDLLLAGCFPLGICISLALQALARNRTGIGQDHAR